MKMQIKRFSECTGVSVRTLHYYDQIGLLKPAEVDERTGYRLYDEACFARMQQILFFRELDLPLKTISEILSAPGYDAADALLAQRELLRRKKERLERLITAVDEALQGGTMNMTALEKNDFEQYKAEAKEKWGGTKAYAEYESKSRGRTSEESQALGEGMEEIFAAFAVCMQSGQSADCAQAQALARQLQEYITAHFYTCTKPILAGLGQMYTADERFRANIDRHAPGTAEYAGKAIEAYCSAH